MRNKVQTYTVQYAYGFMPDIVKTCEVIVKGKTTPEAALKKLHTGKYTVVFYGSQLKEERLA